MQSEQAHICHPTLQKQKFWISKTSPSQPSNLSSSASSPSCLKPESKFYNLPQLQYMQLQVSLLIRLYAPTWINFDPKINKSGDKRSGILPKWLCSSRITFLNSPIQFNLLQKFNKEDRKLMICGAKLIYVGEYDSKRNWKEFSDLAKQM